jgi:hypothetical protein
VGGAVTCRFSGARSVAERGKVIAWCGLALTRQCELRAVAPQTYLYALSEYPWAY